MMLECLWVYCLPVSSSYRSLGGPSGHALRALYTHIIQCILAKNYCHAEIATTQSILIKITLKKLCRKLYPKLNKSRKLANMKFASRYHTITIQCKNHEHLKKNVVLFFTTLRIVAPPKNYPILLDKPRLLFRHPEHQNPSTGDHFMEGGVGARMMRAQNYNTIQK